MTSIAIAATGSRRIFRVGTLGSLLVSVAMLLAACSGGGEASPTASTPPSGGGDGPSGERLAATIPNQVGDMALSVDSGSLPDLKDDLPNYDQLAERLQNADVEPADVLGAVGRPTDGGADPTVGAILVVGAPPGGLGLLGLMEAWTSDMPGATSDNSNVGGKPVVVVTFEDGSLPLYYYLFDTDLTDQETADTLYFVRTTDDALAEDALSQLP